MLSVRRLSDVNEALNVIEKEGILRLKPTWVARSFGLPGARIGLRPDEVFVSGRGPIVERWIASTVEAANPSSPGEGLSYVVAGIDGGEYLVSLSELVRLGGEEILGKDVIKKYGEWHLLAKLLDYKVPIPFHLHHREEQAKLVNKRPKPEAYYYPPELNRDPGVFPYTFFGLSPGTEPVEVRSRLEIWDRGDNHILDLSQAYAQRAGTGWIVPAGVLHAPGSLVTFELQLASDVNAFYQSARYDGVPLPKDLLFADFPPDRKGDLDFALELIDWKENTDPFFKLNHYLEPTPAEDPEITLKEGYLNRWVIYDHELLGARELRLKPRAETTIKDDQPFVIFAISGHGEVDGKPLEGSVNVSLSELTYDEYFVPRGKAKEGVKISNKSPASELVLILYGPNVSTAASIRPARKRAS
ncbi:MAG: hypothetical protein ACP5HK_04615 [Acidilobus sp.]